MGLDVHNLENVGDCNVDISIKDGNVSISCVGDTASLVSALIIAQLNVLSNTAKTGADFDFACFATAEQFIKCSALYRENFDKGEFKSQNEES